MNYIAFSKKKLYFLSLWVDSNYRPRPQCSFQNFNLYSRSFFLFLRLSTFLYFFFSSEFLSLQTFFFYKWYHKNYDKFCVIQRSLLQSSLIFYPRFCNISVSEISTVVIPWLTFSKKVIQSMSFEEEEPLILPDSPRFRVFDENETRLLGRLLNLDCQSMTKKIGYTPTARRVYVSVRGITLSREKSFKYKNDMRCFKTTRCVKTTWFFKSDFKSPHVT